MKELKYVGKEKVRLLGPQIVTGKAKYTGDFKLPGMQYGKILRSPHPYAKIEAIDVEKAKAYPGVTAVVTWKDVDPNIYITNGFTPPKHHHIMDQYDKEYPGYGFASNKGYGTAEHIEAIHRLGITPIHRKSFEPVKSMVMKSLVE